MIETATLDIKSLKKQIAEDIARAIGADRCPAFLTENDLATAKIQTVSKSQHYRACGGAGALPFVKHGHKILYPTGLVLNALISRTFTHTGAYPDSPARIDAYSRNLAKAHKTRKVSGI